MYNKHKCDWYVVQIKPNSSRKALYNLQNQGFKTFYPQQEITIRRGNTFKKKLKSFFSGYVFVYLDLINQQWHKINSTPGGSKIICFNSKPKAISADFMEAMFLKCNNIGIINNKNDFLEGDKVEMVNGPFIKLILEIEKIESDKRIWVLFDFMGKSKKLLTEPKNLQKTNYN